MSQEPAPDLEPTTPAGDQEPATAKGKSGRRSFLRLRRELTDDELATPAVQRMLLDEVEQLEGELADLHVYQEKFHEADKDRATLQERFKSKVSIEILHVACIVVGGAALGYATSNCISQPAGHLALAFGGVLVLAGLLAKAVKP